MARVGHHHAPDPGGDTIGNHRTADREGAVTTGSRTDGNQGSAAVVQVAFEATHQRHREFAGIHDDHGIEGVGPRYVHAEINGIDVDGIEDGFQECQRNPCGAAGIGIRGAAREQADLRVLQGRLDDAVDVVLGDRVGVVERHLPQHAAPVGGRDLESRGLRRGRIDRQADAARFATVPAQRHCQSAGFAVAADRRLDLIPGNDDVVDGRVAGIRAHGVEHERPCGALDQGVESIGNGGGLEIRHHVDHPVAVHFPIGKGREHGVETGRESGEVESGPTGFQRGRVGHQGQPVGGEHDAGFAAVRHEFAHDLKGARESALLAHRERPVDHDELRRSLGRCCPEGEGFEGRLREREGHQGEHGQPQGEQDLVR